MYDIIGDIHGYAGELRQLLERLGYTQRDGIYRHPQRRAIFVGDLIDRGPRIREVLQIVRRMVQAETALIVMGNHEFNALAYHTPHPRDPAKHLREHLEKNKRQHQATLDQLTSDELHDYLEWFRTLPLWLELDGLRVVHACWSPKGIGCIKESLSRFRGVTTSFLAEATTKDTELFHAIEDVLKGPEMQLPEGLTVPDKEGHERRQIRTQWFRSPEGLSLGQYAMPARPELNHHPIPGDLKPTVSPYPEDACPVFFGHYWLTSTPAPQTHNAACLDYSVARHGQLCAYRWNGEAVLHPDRFVCVPSEGPAGASTN